MSKNFSSGENGNKERFVSSPNTTGLRELFTSSKVPSSGFMNGAILCGNISISPYVAPI